VLRQSVYSTLAVLAAAAMATVTVGTADAGEAPAGAHAGPPYNYTTELMGGGGTAVPMKNSLMLGKTKHGYQFRTGQQDSHLVVKVVNGGISFRDTGTQSIKRLSAACDRKKVRRGVAAVCRVPGSVSAKSPLLVEVWPRLGNDFTDASSLPATIAMTVLGDKGHDVARFGAGDDFFNGFSGRDVVRGGAGNDWIRSGLDNDAVKGGAGNDDIVAVEGRDRVRGGSGDDRLWSGDGDDRLWGNAGADFVMCGNGRDSATADQPDRIASSCESVERR